MTPSRPPALDPMVWPFPRPPQDVERTAAAMAMVAAGDQDVIEALGDVHQLPRPWIPVRARLRCVHRSGTGATWSPAGSTPSCCGDRPR